MGERLEMATSAKGTAVDWGDFWDFGLAVLFGDLENDSVAWTHPIT